MGRMLRGVWVIIVGTVLFFTTKGISHGNFLHAPHDGPHGISCKSCHAYPLDGGAWPPGFPPANPTADDTLRNYICLRCHDGSADGPDEIAAPVKTMHSSLALGGKYTGWTTECVDCHDPHFQAQLDHSQRDADRFFLVSGTILGIETAVQAGATRITYSYDESLAQGRISGNWRDTTTWSAKTSPGRGLLFLPDRNQPAKTYEITAADASSITVAGVLDPSFTGKTFGIIYGQLIRPVIDFSGEPRTVKFFDPYDGFTGADGRPVAGGLVDESGSGTPEGICQVCHTRTTHWKKDGAGTPHYNQKCTDCHQISLGFKFSCSACHGNPPGPLVAYNGATGSQTAGAHGKHNALNISCANCHYGSVGTGPTHAKGDLLITLGFYHFGGLHQGGSYDGQAAAGYNSTATVPATTTARGGTLACQNVYCHGNYPGSGLNAAPRWDNPASGACGTCHSASNAAWPGSGTHKRHTSNYLTLVASQFLHPDKEYPCTLCHKGIVGGNGPANYSVSDPARHVNGKVDWQFDTSDNRLEAGTAAYSIPAGTQPPSNGTAPRAYGACSNVYCHSIVQTDAGGPLTPDTPDYKTVTWGAPDTFSCNCHNTLTGSHGGTDLTSGSHPKHLPYFFKLASATKMEKCTICHKWNTTAPFGDCNQCHSSQDEKTLHVNGTVEVRFDKEFGSNAGYSGTPVPGDGFGACANTYCHSDGTAVATGAVTPNTTPAWGAGAIGCNPCHGYPPAYGNNDPKANSHPAHRNYACASCHDTRTICNDCHAYTGSNGTSPENHVNKAYNLQAVGGTITFTPTVGKPSSCAAISCHGGGSATWGGASLDCQNCHTGAGDVDDYAFGNGTLARIDNAEWQSAGHGKNTTPLPLACSYCHDRAAAHNTEDNPFRLANLNALGNGANDVCLVCHKTDSAGYDPDGAGGPLSAKTSSMKVDKYHQLHAHAESGRNGGKFCWDCHDPHGDGANIRMVQANPAPVTDGINGVPASVPVKTVVFTNTTATGPGGFARTSGNFGEGICNACHRQSAASPKMQHYTSTSSDSHNADTACTSCHRHSENTVVNGDAFKAGCDGCHAYPPVTNAHTLHVTTLKYSCDECHFGNSHNPRNLATTPAQFLNAYDRSLVDVAFDPAGFNSDANNGAVLGPPAFTKNGASGLATCANLACHNPDNSFTGKGSSSSTNNIPTWGATITSCTACHTDSSAYGSDVDGGSHHAHVDNDMGASIGCVSCHAAVNVTDPESRGTDPRHADKTLNIDQNGDYPVLVEADLAYRHGVTAIYSDGAPGTKTGSTCAAVYCHGDLASDIGNNPTFTWGVTKISDVNTCRACHKFASDFTDTQVYNRTAAKSHFAHLDASGAVYPNGPRLSSSACTTCHTNIGSGPSHGDGRVDLIGAADGSLAQTTACDSCHSPDGVFDGVNDPVIGAKANWTGGVYDGTALAAGKEKWCLGCHDAGTSVIPAGSTYKPRDFAGNTTTYGYFVSGHGGKAVGCEGCHDLKANHNFDGKRTYKASLNNYRIGFRLKIMPDGSEPLRIPALVTGNGCDYQSGDFALCYSCHSEEALLSDTKARGVYDCTTNPFKNKPAITTGFRNVSAAGYMGISPKLEDIPANIHWDHLVDIHSLFSTTRNVFYDSDLDQVEDTKTTCVTCHNPHGPPRLEAMPSPGGPPPTEKMTVRSLDITTGVDTTGVYGSFGPLFTPNRCYMCHWDPGSKYYRQSVPLIDTFSLTDRNNADPMPPRPDAVLHFTNERTVRFALTATGLPQEMAFYENPAGPAASDWRSYANAGEYTLSAGDGPKKVYLQLRNSYGVSAASSTDMVLDTTPPTLAQPELTSPVGGEVWRQGTSVSITWNVYLSATNRITDANLSTYCVTLDLSTDGGATFPIRIATNMWLSGDFTWTVPAISTTRAKVRFTVTDDAGNQKSDVSGGVFTIAP